MNLISFKVRDILGLKSGVMFAVLVYNWCNAAWCLCLTVGIVLLGVSALVEFACSVFAIADTAHVQYCCRTQLLITAHSL